MGGGFRHRQLRRTTTRMRTETEQRKRQKQLSKSFINSYVETISQSIQSAKVARTPHPDQHRGLVPTTTYNQRCWPTSAKGQKDSARAVSKIVTPSHHNIPLLQHGHHILS